VVIEDRRAALFLPSIRDPERHTRVAKRRLVEAEERLAKIARGEPGDGRFELVEIEQLDAASPASVSAK